MQVRPRLRLAFINVLGDIALGQGAALAASVR
jgi:hypothetical protein